MFAVGAVGIGLIIWLVCRIKHTQTATPEEVAKADAEDHQLLLGGLKLVTIVIGGVVVLFVGVCLMCVHAALEHS